MRVLTTISITPEDQPIVRFDSAGGNLEICAGDYSITVEEGLFPDLQDVMMARPIRPGKYDSTIREALRIAVTAAENDGQAERFEAALAAMDHED